MTNLMLLLLAALTLNCAPAICAEPSDQDHEDGLSKRSPAGSTPKKSIRYESQAGSASTSATDSAPATSSNSQSDVTGTATSSQPGSVDSTSTPTPSHSEPAVARSAALPSEVTPGPYETDRRNVRNWLLAANKRGVGLGAYIPVWEDMESTVKSGGTDAAIKAKLDTICHNISEQVRNSSAIQRFRPAKAKPGKDQDYEYIPVQWIGEKGSDPLFRDKADKWYNRAVDLLNPEERADPLLRRRLHDQRDMIYKEMSENWKETRQWAPKLYKNMNQDLGAKMKANPYAQPKTNEVDPHVWYGGTEERPTDKNSPR